MYAILTKTKKVLARNEAGAGKKVKGGDVFCVRSIVTI